jgi:hypothetical protein
VGPGFGVTERGFDSGHHAHVSGHPLPTTALDDRPTVRDDCVEDPFPALFKLIRNE